MKQPGTDSGSQQPTSTREVKGASSSRSRLNEAAASTWWSTTWDRIYGRRFEVERESNGGFWFWLGKYYLFGILALILHALAFGAWVYGDFARGVPLAKSPEQYRQQAPAITRVLAYDGRPLAEFATEYRKWVSIDRIPKRLQQAFQAVEDRRFYEHHGIDWRGIIRAAWTNLKAGRIRQGGSTITQQVAKSWLGPQRTLTRKIREAILARRLERVLTKAQILELYLNKIFLGNGAYGVAAAAKRYFDKRLDQIDLAQMALLAALARAPSRYSPVLHPRRAKARRNLVLEKMREMGVITKQEEATAAAEPFGLRGSPDAFFRVSPYYAEQVRQWAIEYLGKRAIAAGKTCHPDRGWADLQPKQQHLLCIRQLGKAEFYRGGYLVETAADTWMQDSARRNADELARWMDKRQGWRGPEAYLSSEDARKEFLDKAARRYSSGPLDPRRLYLALVREVTRNGALVQIGSLKRVIPIDRMRWAGRYVSQNGTTDRHIKYAWQALMPGDVVWVKAGSPRVGSPKAGSPKTGSARAGSPRTDHRPQAGRTSVRHPVGPREPLAASHPAAPHRTTGAARRRALALPRSWPRRFVSLEQTPRLQSALVTFDHETGYVLSMVGGTDFDLSSFNRVTQACRQPGSTFKPIYYSLALDHGWAFDRKIKDMPYSLVDPVTGKKWYVRDFRYNKDLMKRFQQAIKSYQVTLEFALVWSKNNASVHVFRTMGANNVVRWARRLGFTTPLIADDALALGASCTKMDELARAFGIFARNGRWLDLTWVRRLVDRSGKVLVDHTVYYDPTLSTADKLDRLAATLGHRPKQAIPAKTAYRTSILLRRMVQKGHAEVVRMTGLLTAGKTGTSSRTSDTWFVGYTSRWLTAAWMGDDKYERPIGTYDASFNTALPMWARYMFEVSGRIPVRDIPWKNPDGTWIHKEAGLPQTHGKKPLYKAPLGRMKKLQQGRQAARQYETGFHNPQ